MSLHGCRVLVVEDNYAMGERVASLIQEAGAAICGPFPTIGKALPLALNENLSGAILDVMVRDGTSVSIAEALRRRQVPFVVVSGYGRAVVPHGMRRAPFLAKPIVDCDLIGLAARYFRLPDKESAGETTGELLDLADRARRELLALTGNSGIMVMADTLPKRLRTPASTVDRAILLAERKGWLVRKGPGVRLTELGRSALAFPESSS